MVGEWLVLLPFAELLLERVGQADAVRARRLPPGVSAGRSARASRAGACLALCAGRVPAGAACCTTQVCRGGPLSWSPPSRWPRPQIVPRTGREWSSTSSWRACALVVPSSPSLPSSRASPWRCLPLSSFPPWRCPARTRWTSWLPPRRRTAVRCWSPRPPCHRPSRLRTWPEPAAWTGCTPLPPARGPRRRRLRGGSRVPPRWPTSPAVLVSWSRRRSARVHLEVDHLRLKNGSAVGHLPRVTPCSGNVEQCC